MTQDLNNPYFYWAVKNDGSQLFKDTAMKYLESKSQICIFYKDWYYGFKNKIGYYGCTSCSEEDYPSYLSVQQFADLHKAYIEGKEDKKWQPEVGDIVEVNNGLDNLWQRRIYLTTIISGFRKFICINELDNSDFVSEKSVNVTRWMSMRKIQKTVKTEFTLEDMKKAYYKSVLLPDMLPLDNFYDFIKTL